MGKGYTKEGFPIVWLKVEKRRLHKDGKLDGLSKEQVKELVWQACRDKKERDGVDVSGGSGGREARSFQKLKVGALNVEFATDPYQIILNTNSRTTYHRNLESVARYLFDTLQRRKLSKGVSEIKDLYKFVKNAKMETLDGVKKIAKATKGDK